MKPYFFISALAILAAISHPILAQEDGIKILAPASPGGGWDQTARAIQQALYQAQLEKSVHVSNVPKAGGMIGLAQFASQAEGDPHSWMIGGFVMVGAGLINKSRVNLSRLTPLARLTEEYELVVVSASSPHKNLRDLLAAMKADPGSVAWAGGPAGGIEHITVGRLAQEGGADPARMNYVPFSGGGDALAALMGGQVAASVGVLSEWEYWIRAGKIRALCITAAERLAHIDIPTCREAGSNVILANWRGVFGGPDLSPTDRAKAVALLDKMVASEEWKKILKQKKWLDSYISGDLFIAFIAEENQRIERVLKSIGLVR